MRTELKKAREQRISCGGKAGLRRDEPTSLSGTVHGSVRDGRPHSLGRGGGGAGAAAGVVHQPPAAGVRPCGPGGEDKSPLLQVRSTSTLDGWPMLYVCM